MVVGTRGRVDVAEITVGMGSGGDGADREVEGLETGEETDDIIGSETELG